MFSELSERIERSLPDGSLLRAKLDDFINTYNKKIFNLTSQLAEITRRNTEKTHRWTEIHEKYRRCNKQIQHFEEIIKTQRDQFKKILAEKNIALAKANKHLAVIASGNTISNTDYNNNNQDGGEQQTAAKFLFETLQKYITENDKSQITCEALETTLFKKTQRIQELEEMYQTLMEQSRKSQTIIVNIPVFFCLICFFFCYTNGTYVYFFVGPALYCSNHGC